MNVDESFRRFKEIAGSYSSVADKEFSESDSRAKIIDPIFKECLNWNEDEIVREEHVHEGFIDYVFKIRDRPMFVLEAKKTGVTFTIPYDLSRNRYRLDGPLMSDKNIKDAIEQAHGYSIESGTTFAVISNGHQFLIFETFRFGARWREGLCLVFKSFEDIVKNFTLFWDVFSKESIDAGSLRRHVSQEIQPLEYKRPLDAIPNQGAETGENILAPLISPLIQHIFGDLTSDEKIEILQECYVQQGQTAFTGKIIESHFARVSGFDQNLDISWFKDEESGKEGFQVSFDRCREFLRKLSPIGFTILLLGGIGSGKTTFIHHFFKIAMKDRKDIIWFYVDFGKSPVGVEKIEQMVYESIIKCYEDHYKPQLEKFLYEVGIAPLRPNERNMLRFFSMLRFRGFTTSIVLDNVDQHSYTNPDYQEHVFQLSRYLTGKLKTIVVLTLREESYFRSRKSGVLDAYLIPKFHIESPDFEELLRSRIDYTLKFLGKSEGEIMKALKGVLPQKEHWDMIQQLFKIVEISIRKDRRVGRDILKFLNDVTGGNMRKALDFFNTYVTSANTDVAEMINIERTVQPSAPVTEHYQIPLHHMIKSIMLENHEYYSSSHSSIMNLFQVNPQYTNSHFIHIRILDYLRRRSNYYVALELGFVPINEILENAEIAGVGRRAVEDSLKRLSVDGLIRYDNQLVEGFQTAKYIRITNAGKYYVDNLINRFAYLDLACQDTPISDSNVVVEITSRLLISPRTDRRISFQIRLERTRAFLDYLKKEEENEFKTNPSLTLSDLTRHEYMDGIIQQYTGEVTYIESKLEEKYW